MNKAVMRTDYMQQEKDTLFDTIMFSQQILGYLSIVIVLVKD